MVNLQQSVLLLMVPSKNWVRPHHRSSISMLDSDSTPVCEFHDKLHQWLTRVKPINSFISHVLPVQHGRQIQHDLSEMSAFWLNVHSGDNKWNFQWNGLSNLKWIEVLLLPCISLDFTDLVMEKQQVWSFADHLDLKEGNALCLHRWKIWWSIPKLLKSRKYPEADIPPETYFLLSKLQVTTLLSCLKQFFSFSRHFIFEGWNFSAM